jgi:hypothetical protein
MSDEHLLGECVEIAAFTLLGEAQTAATTLRAAGIPVHLRNEAVAGVLPHMTNAFGGIGVCVPEADAEQGRALLTGAIPPGEPDDLPAAALGAEQQEAGPLHDGPRAASARRAWRAAILGLAFLPGLLHLISLWHLVGFARAAGPAPARSVRHAIGALIVDGLVAAGVASLVVLACRGR